MVADVLDKEPLVVLQILRNFIATSYNLDLTINCRIRHRTATTYVHRGILTVSTATETNASGSSIGDCTSGCVVIIPGELQ